MIGKGHSEAIFSHGRPTTSGRRSRKRAAPTISDSWVVLLPDSQDDGGDLYEKSLWIKSVLVHVFDLELRGTGSTEGIKESNHLQREGGEGRRRGRGRGRGREGGKERERERERERKRDERG